MRQVSEKLLAVLLTLLLGLSPLQGVMTGFATSSDQEKRVHQLADMHSDKVMDTDHATPDCEQCNVDDGCTGLNCSSGQCASCVLAVLPDSSHPMDLTTTSGFIRTDGGFISQLSSSLFRPPKA
jgi:hypothetical protein